MASEYGPNASVAWLSAKADAQQVAGAAFLVNSRLAVTCAHVVRDHLGHEAPATAALAQLAEGDTEPAGRVLQALLDTAPERTVQERREAAALARSLGVLAYLDNTERALRAHAKPR
jgi:V8-like Glu-specific endopeptidase